MTRCTFFFPARSGLDPMAVELDVLPPVGATVYFWPEGAIPLPDRYDFNQHGRKWRVHEHVFSLQIHTDKMKCFAEGRPDFAAHVEVHLRKEK